MPLGVHDIQQITLSKRCQNNMWGLFELLKLWGHFSTSAHISTFIYWCLHTSIIQTPSSLTVRTWDDWWSCVYPRLYSETAFSYVGHSSCNLILLVPLLLIMLKNNNSAKLRFEQPIQINDYSAFQRFPVPLVFHFSAFRVVLSGYYAPEAFAAHLPLLSVTVGPCPSWQQITLAASMD